MTRQTIFVLAALAGGAAAAWAQGASVDKKHVYYGNPDSFSKPAEIRLLDVFQHIPEYLEARKKPTDDPEYYLLLEKANKKFRTALDKAAEKGSYDLVAEKGSVENAPKTVPDITRTVIEQLPDAVSYANGAQP